MSCCNVTSPPSRSLPKRRLLSWFLDLLCLLRANQRERHLICVNTQHVIELKLEITHFVSNRKSYNGHIASLDMRCKISSTCTMNCSGSIHREEKQYWLPKCSDTLQLSCADCAREAKKDRYIISRVHHHGLFEQPQVLSLVGSYCVS